ncbi:GMC oxidoreductase [Actibacterium sp. 188UL27-1]|uniref:GMC oxidoreductase n=1 Tax=Actibacterium sp. 188UL27-1 TaxID=2786961 RepID=UPI00195CB5C9|nr:GMC oxidoreductase [Actibacterium sp. 188UL27-1]MBM7069081.1 GMC family oxidoreductase [Actibacterium sp. 188UL27-1]
MPLVAAQTARAKSYDICVVGAGAAGLALGFAATTHGLSVLIVDRGEVDPPDVPNADDEHVFGTDTPHDPRAKTNSDALGGTLHRWGGRCVPFDPQDFDDRGETALPRWPISYGDYAKWIEPAATFLGSGSVFTSPPPEPWFDAPGLSADRVEHLNDPNHVNRVQERAKNDPNGPDIVTQTLARMVCVIGARSQIELQTAGELWTPDAAEIVLAAGGLETARLLLVAQAQNPGLFGGSNGPLGRYYMGHLTGSVGELTFGKASHVTVFGYAQFGPTQARRRIMLDPEDWTNTAFWIENTAPDDPRHRSGELSFKHLIANRGRSGDLSAHMRNILTDPFGVPNAVRSALYRRLRPHSRYPNRLIARGRGPYRLCFHAEQRPLPHNRVQLSNAKDRHGQPKLKIDFHYDDDTIRALVRDHRRLADRLNAANLATLDLPDDDAVMAKNIAQQSRDGYHQIGLTRMADTPIQGIVDRNCKVHDVQNLSIASAAIFPVSSQANPTLSVVAFALRLADFLCERHKTKGETATKGMSG